MKIFTILKENVSFCYSFVSLVVIVLFICTVNCYSAQLTLSWSQNSGDGTEGYKIYYGDSSKEYNSVIDAGNQTSYTITDLIEGNTYFIAITAYNNSGKESGFSEEISYVAYHSNNNLPASHLKDDKGKQKSVKHWSVPVYAIKHTRLVHRPTCKSLFEEMKIRYTNSEKNRTPTSNNNALNSRIIELENQITSLRIKYLDDHPKIVLLKNRINNLEKQLDEETPKAVKEETVKVNSILVNMLASDGVTKYSSLEQAIKIGCIACLSCKP